jgi:murein L,D-transpeptidase YafK
LLAVPALAALVSACSTFGGMPRDKLPLSGAALTNLRELGSSPTAPMLVRIFKESSDLEVWKQAGAGTYRLFRTYRICKWSGSTIEPTAERDPT